MFVEDFPFFEKFPKLMAMAKLNWTNLISLICSSERFATCYESWVVHGECVDMLFNEIRMELGELFFVLLHISSACLIQDAWRASKRSCFQVYRIRNQEL